MAKSKDNINYCVDSSQKVNIIIIVITIYGDNCLLYFESTWKNTSKKMFSRQISTKNFPYTGHKKDHNDYESKLFRPYIMVFQILDNDIWSGKSGPYIIV